MIAGDTVFSLNLRALELFDARTAVRIARCPTPPEPDFPIMEAASGWSLPILKAADTVVLQGIGDGSRMLQLLGQPLGRVLVLECEAAACVAVLSRIDLSVAFAGGRLRLLLMPAQSPIVREISLRECMSELTDCLHRPNSTLHFVATSTMSRHADFFGLLLQGVQQAAQEKDRFAKAGVSATAFDVTVVSPCCAIFDDLAQCFHKLGLRTQLLRVPDREGVWTAEQRRAAQLSLASAPSRLVITRNRALFETDQATAYPQPEALIQGSVAMWWWDLPNLATYIDLQHPRGNAHAFGFAREILPLLPQRTEWLPPGARMAFVEAGAQPPIVQDISLSFVGQSRLQDLHANLRHLDSVLRDLGGSAPALARDIDHARSYVQLHSYLAAHQRDIQDAIVVLAPAFPAHAYYLNYLLEMAVSGAFRIGAIEHLLHEGVEISVFGDEDWLKLTGMSPVHFKGLIAPVELPTLYRRSRLNLNLNFMQVSSTVNPKVLDISACGGVALTDYRPELELLYPDPATRPFAFQEIDELPEKLAALLRLDMTQHCNAVREHTCRHHTLQQRADWIARKFGLLKEN